MCRVQLDRVEAEKSSRTCLLRCCYAVAHTVPGEHYSPEDQERLDGLESPKSQVVDIADGSAQDRAEVVKLVNALT